MASTNISSTPTPTGNRNSSKKFQISWPSRQAVTSFLRRLFTIIGRLGAGAIVLFVLAHFVPELRNEMPNFYRFVDFIINTIEWAYTVVLSILTWNKGASQLRCAFNSFLYYNFYIILIIYIHYPFHLYIQNNF